MFSLYLLKPPMNFKINMYKLVLVQKYGNKSQMSWENTIGELFQPRLLVKDKFVRTRHPAKFKVILNLLLCRQLIFRAIALLLED